MRTAEEILLKETGGIIDEYEAGITGILNAMHLYAKEAIEECFQRAELDLTDNYKGVSISEKPFNDLINEIKQW